MSAWWTGLNTRERGLVGFAIGITHNKPITRSFHVPSVGRGFQNCCKNPFDIGRSTLERLQYGVSYGDVSLSKFTAKLTRNLKITERLIVSV